MAEVSVNGVVFHYEDDYFGPPFKKRIPVVIQHGNGRNSEFWRHWVPPLAAEYRLIRRDQRGHGRTEDPGRDSRWAIELMVDDLRLFVEALDLPAIHYIGESSGGVIGATFASEYPECLRSLTLCGTPVRLPTPWTSVIDDSIVSPDRESFARSIIDQRIVSAGPSHAYTEWAVGQLAEVPPHVLAGMASTVQQAGDLASILPSIHVPTLILAPTRSPLTTLDQQQELLDGIPDAVLEVVDGASHEIYIDESEACLAAVKKFLSLH